MEEKKFITKTEDETKSIAFEFAKGIVDGDIVLLSGDLGAGKTVFTKGFILGRGITTEEVVSPTFVIVNQYGEGRVNHFDLYRLNSPMELEATGMVEQIYSSSISIIEWPEVVGFDYFPSSAYVVTIKKLSDTEREISIKRNC